MKDKTMRGTRSRIVAAVIAGASALGLVTAVSSVATAAPAQTPTPSVQITDNPPGSKYLGTNWDGATLNLDWKGNTYQTARGSFIGTPVSVPGDQAVRTLNVKNNGPGAGVLTVKIINATVTDPQSPTPDVNTDLQNLIDVMWNAGSQAGTAVFKDLAAAPGGTTEILAVSIGKGQTIPVKIGYEYPYEATTGKNLGAPSQILKFDVLLYIQGTGAPGPNETPLTFTPTPGPHKSSVSGSAAGTTSASGGGGTMARTGAIGLVGAAVLAVFFILLGLGLKRRRKDEDPEAPPSA